MKLSRKLGMMSFGAAVLMLAGAAGAQTYNDVWVHGNACTGGGAVPSAYGATNSSTTNSATVNCPIQAAWPLGAGAQQRWLQLVYWNRSSTAGAFTCKVVGLDANGNKVFDPATQTVPAGAPNSSPQTLNIGQPPLSAQFFNVSCTIPKSSGAGGGSSYISGIALRVAS